MISQTLIDQTKEFAYGEYEKYQTPPVYFVDLVNKKGQELAEQFHANKDIVLLGTILMDSLLGKAKEEGRQKEHAMMAVEKTKELLSSFGEVPEEECENVLNCIREHHGVSKFYSIESEVCCNADCYKFISAEGFLGGLFHYGAFHFKNEGLTELIQLFSAKAEEKWNALTLEVCKKELEPQYKAIKTLMGEFKV